MADVSTPGTAPPGAVPEGPGESAAERFCLVLCELALVGMVVLTFAEIVLRGIANVSLEITDEVGGYLLAAMTFLSLPVALIGGSFHQVEYVQARLGPRARIVMRLVFTALSLVFVLLLEWQLGRLVLRSYASEVQAPTLLGTPMWIPQSAMLVGAGFLIYALGRVLAHDLRRLSRERS